MNVLWHVYDLNFNHLCNIMVINSMPTKALLIKVQLVQIAAFSKHRKCHLWKHSIHVKMSGGGRQDQSNVIPRSVALACKNKGIPLQHSNAVGIMRRPWSPEEQDTERLKIPQPTTQPTDCWKPISNNHSMEESGSSTLMKPYRRWRLAFT